MAVEPYFDKHAGLVLTSDSLIINGEEGWMQITIKVISGTVSITGDPGERIGGVLCGAVDFSAGETFTFGSGLSSVDNLTIDATAGSVKIWGVKSRNPS